MNLLLEEAIHKPILTRVQTKATPVFLEKKVYKLEDVIKIKGHVKSMKLVGTDDKSKISISNRIRKVSILNNKASEPGV